MRKYSIVIPVYNRPIEVYELLQSLTEQQFKNFEVLIIEDGSGDKSEDVVKQFREKLDIKYHFKANSGPGNSRNFGMQKATGDYVMLFDSDCLIPPDYFKNLENVLNGRPLDAFGGPDNAHISFSDVQKAINYAMTSFLTTGGVRGKKSKLDKFQPRSFNMGLSKEVIEKVGGFSDIHPGEDPDLSFRIMDAGFKVGLIEEAYVYHKRRIDFSKFSRQVYKFGVVRVILMKWYPKRKSLVYFFPSIFVFGLIGLIASGIFITPWFLTPIGLYILLLFVDSLAQSGRLNIACMSVMASFIQLTCYAYGFTQSFIKIMMLRIPERKAFPKFFFNR
ncbi:MAG: glycosyltransferase [Bacteroidetes bacterium]|jgi:glycosyltransferase involved in cell wall biosynthesis|nr:glycosyltransferase [Bacteroidota bacterium]